MESVSIQFRGERERLFGSREREGKLKITFPFYGKGKGIRKMHCFDDGLYSLCDVSLFAKSQNNCGWPQLCACWSKIEFDVECFSALFVDNPNFHSPTSLNQF